MAIIAVWCPSLPASFQFDDWNVIVDESRVHSLTAWWASMPGIRPLLKLSYALNYSISAEPLGFRVGNVAIHALSALLVGWLLRVRGHRAGLSDSHAMSAALLGALVFALHPVQTEAVTYISGRSSSLAAFFCLLSLCSWVRSEQGANSRGAKAWLIACAATYAAAIACKETAFVLPLALWLYSADRPVRATLMRLAPLLLLAITLLAIAYSLPTYRHLLAVSLETRSIGENLLTQSHALFYLAGQLVQPWNGNADPQLIVVTRVDTLTALLCMVWAVALIAALFYVRRAPIGAFAVLWFLLWLAPTNSFLPRLDPANDRQLYLALIGPAWWLAVCLMRMTNQRSLAVLALATLATGVLGAATIDRNRVYNSEVSFWEDALLRNPANARAANNLGMAYALDCRFDEALSAFAHAVALDSSDYRAKINRALLQHGQLPGIDEQTCQAHRK
jgi:tetratricopeptide (TPR) repeat protein